MLLLIQNTADHCCLISHSHQVIQTCHVYFYWELVNLYAQTDELGKDEGNFPETSFRKEVPHCLSFDKHPITVKTK